MKAIPLGTENRTTVEAQERHLASSVGNAGVHVVSTPSLIGFLELASHALLLPYLEEGEVSVGTRVEVDHLAAAFLGRPIIAIARVAAVEKRRITFEVEARQDGRVVMKGRHGRAVVSRERLLAARSPSA
jgi:fluoroacetyl-CoA thioesterase